MNEDQQDALADGLMTILQVAQFAQVTRSTVYNWLNHSGLPSVKVGKTRRIPRRALLDFLREHLG